MMRSPRTSAVPVDAASLVSHAAVVCNPVLELLLTVGIQYVADDATSRGAVQQLAPPTDAAAQPRYAGHGQGGAQFQRPRPVDTT